MRRHSMDDATAERLLRGSAPAGRPELEPLSLLLAQVRSLADAEPTPTPALYALLRDGFEPGSAVTTGRAPARSALRRRLAALAGLSLGLKVLTGTGVALAGVTAGAGAGVLPDVVQDRVADVIRTVTPFDLDPRPAVPSEPSEPSEPADERGHAPRGPDGEGPAHGEPVLPEQAPMHTPPRRAPQQPVPAPAPREDRKAPGSERGPDGRPAPAPRDRPAEGEPRREVGPAQQGRTVETPAASLPGRPATRVLAVDSAAAR